MGKTVLQLIPNLFLCTSKSVWDGLVVGGWLHKGQNKTHLAAGNVATGNRWQPLASLATWQPEVGQRKPDPHRQMQTQLCMDGDKLQATTNKNNNNNNKKQTNKTKQTPDNAKCN